MGCFCHASVAPLGSLIASLEASGMISLSANVTGSAMVGANIAAALEAWLAEHALPAAPWAPDPAWLNVPLPQIRLSGIATLSALAQLQAQVQAQLGINLLQPAGAQAFARVMATLQARLSAIAALPGMGSFSAAPMLRLSAVMNAVVAVRAALQAGVFAMPSAQLAAYALPPIWAPFLAELRNLAAMLAVCAQLNVHVNDTAALSAAVRALVQLRLPTFPPAQALMMAQLTAMFSAMASLKLALGLPSLPALPQLTAMVQARLNATLTAVAQAMGMSLRGLTPEAALAALLGLLPRIPPVPTGYATPVVVNAAFSAQALAALNWNVPPMLLSTQVALPACAFAEQLSAALNVNAVLPSPCASGCDAARLMRDLTQALGA